MTGFDDLTLKSSNNLGKVDINEHLKFHAQ